MAKRLISSENYVIPVILAVGIELIVLVGLFYSWSSTPDIPPAKPTMIATLYELNSKSPATKQSSEKFAGESQKTKAKTTQEDQLASQLEDQKKIADARAKADAEAKKKADAKAKADAEVKKKAEAKSKADAEAKKKAEAKAKADEAKKIADAKAKAEAKKKAEEKAKADAEAKKKADAKAKADAEAKKKADAKNKADAEAKKKADAARKAKEAKEAAALTDLLGDKVERAATKGDQVGSQVVGSLDDLVKQLVTDNWIVQGNPSPDTTVGLLIEMLPDGTITNVTISRSSGNTAFDNSAVTAARNVGRIPEIQQLDADTFNQLYRKRAFVFTAKGL